MGTVGAHGRQVHALGRDTRGYVHTVTSPDEPTMRSLCGLSRQSLYSTRECGRQPREGMEEENGESEAVEWAIRVNPCRLEPLVLQWQRRGRRVELLWGLGSRGASSLFARMSQSALSSSVTADRMTERLHVLGASRQNAFSLPLNFSMSNSLPRGFTKYSSGCC